MNPALSSLYLRHLEAAEYSDPPDFFEWAERKFKVPSEGGNPISFRWDYAPYWREIATELICPDNKEVALQLFSRGGKTMLCLMVYSYFILEAQRRLAIMRPSNANAEDFAKKEVQAGLIDLLPDLYGIFGDGTNRRKRFVTIQDKLFPGGHLKILGANVAGDIRQVQASGLWGDEIDAIEQDAKSEGDPMNRFRKRGNQFPERLIWWSSYPGFHGKSRIQRALDASDYRKWTVNCLKCGDPWVFEREENLKYDKDKPEKARLECSHCEAQHDDDARAKMVRAGRWVKSQPEIKAMPGFWASSMLWPHEINRDEYPGGYLQQLAEAELRADAAENPEEERQTIVNMEDAKPYKRTDLDTPEPEGLIERAERYDPRQSIPEGVLVIAAGADLQGDRIEMEVVGFGEGFREWGLGYHIIHGEPKTEALQKAFCQLIDTLKFQHPTIGEMKIDRVGLDCGFEGDWVKKICVQRKDILRPVRGRNQYAGGRGVDKITKNEKYEWEGKMRVISKVYEVNTHYLKRLVYESLMLDPASNPRHGSHWPKGNGYDMKYFRGLTMETPREKSEKGNHFLFFDDKEVKGNEPLDCRVYAKAIMSKMMTVLRDRRDEMKGTEDPQKPDPGTKPVRPPRPRSPRRGRKNFVTDY